MKQHQYHVTVQHLKDAKGQASTYTERLEFYTEIMMIFFRSLNV